MLILSQFELTIFVLLNVLLRYSESSPGIRTNEDHDAPLADYYFELGSRHMSYIFRHTNLLHEDGSLSLHELLYHQATARKIRAMYREGLQSLIQLDVGEVPISETGTIQCAS